MERYKLAWRRFPENIFTFPPHVFPFQVRGTPATPEALWQVFYTRHEHLWLQKIKSPTSQVWQYASKRSRIWIEMSHDIAWANAASFYYLVLTCVPDWPIRNFKASKSVNRRFWTTQSLSTIYYIFRFWGPEIVKTSVGYRYRTQT